jgi:hypothetical protein
MGQYRVEPDVGANVEKGPGALKTHFQYPPRVRLEAILAVPSDIRQDVRTNIAGEVELNAVVRYLSPFSRTFRAICRPALSVSARTGRPTP